MRRILPLALFALALPLFGQRTPISIGDAIIIVPSSSIVIGAPSGSIPVLLDNNGAFKQIFRSVSANVVAFDARGHLLAAFGPSLLDLDEMVVVDHPFTGQPIRDSILSLAAAPNGEIFALTASSDVLEISADRKNVKRIVIPDIGFPVAHAGIDLAPDGCTLYYFTHNSEIARYDVCTGAPLPKFLPNVPFTAFRVLGDGGVVAASGETIQFYDSAARFFKSIVVSGSPATSIAFDADPAYVWADVPGYLVKIRISDGRHITVSPFITESIALRGERRPTTLDLTGGGRRRGSRH